MLVHLSDRIRSGTWTGVVILDLTGLACALRGLQPLCQQKVWEFWAHVAVLAVFGGVTQEFVYRIRESWPRPVMTPVLRG